MKTVCGTCMHHCGLEPGQKGRCMARMNREGVIICETYGRVTSLALDPIEKKPLKRFHPGSRILSVGSYGCNLSCPFCQNHEISMAEREEIPTWVYLTPEELAERARAYQRMGNIGLAFTYNEPLVGWEYVRDTFRLVKESGMATVLVTNGCGSPEVLEVLLPLTDAMNIDLKGFQETYYRQLGGSLATVKASIVRAAPVCHVELTTLIVPGENDTLEETEAEAAWIASIDRDIPLHITRFFPRHHMTDRQATDVGLLYRLAETAGKYLRHVYVGNV